MKKDNVYLAGPMEGLTYVEQTAWRNSATRELGFADISTLDPCRRPHDGRSSLNSSRRIFKCDLQDIANSTVVLANLSDSLPGKKWGTVAEIAHSHTLHKIIIVILSKDQFMHPFIQSYATEIHFSLEDALDTVKEYYL
jgi:nucleoside 2-deoxyribosyltransferase